MHANIFAIKCIVRGSSSDATHATRHRHIISIDATTATASVQTVSNSTTQNLWQLNEIGKSENCIIIKSNQHEIKCLKWKFYRDS